MVGSTSGVGGSSRSACDDAAAELERVQTELVAARAEIARLEAENERASHGREHGRRRFVTDPAHMPPSHRAHLEWTPSRLVSWARSVSPHAAALAEKILASKPHPEHSYRACLGLMNLAKRYGNERVGAACERALASGAISYSSVKSILAQNLDRPPCRRLLPRHHPRPSTRTCAAPAITPRKRRPEQYVRQPDN